MSRLFISHSSKNNAEAIAIRDWLDEAGWNDVFLDLDPERGIKAGERWEKALIAAASRCEAVLFVISPAWLGSEWCQEEFDLARHLNKTLFGVIIDKDVRVEDLPKRLKGTWQAVNLARGRDLREFHVVLPVTHEKARVSFSKEGLARLRGGLAKAGLDPRFFAWPPQSDLERSPYRGLKPLEAEDAGIFFGRDAPIVEALARLRELRRAASPRILVILGASGSGKSSFLRAGLLPRLTRDDRNFLPLPVIRPERGAVSGETGLISALEAALAEYDMPRARAEIRETVAKGPTEIRALLRQLVQKAVSRMVTEGSEASPPAVVLGIDQAEELFFGEGAAEGEALLGFVRDLASEDQPAIISLFTIRTESYDRLQTAKPLQGLRQETLPLLPVPRGAYQTIVEGPAARLDNTPRKIEIEPRLTQRLLEDIEKGAGSDALPLLAFTLEQLYVDYGRARGQLRLADYEAFGGIRGSIEAAVERALIAADADPRIPRDRDARLTLLRRGFIPWLAGIDSETGSPRRRIARVTDVPPEAEPLIRLLVEQRLLATDTVNVREDGRERHEITIEPAHEALLRQWGLLRNWLQEDFAALTTLEAVKRAAREWTANAKSDDWLSHTGTRLQEAERFSARADLARDLDAEAREYLRLCRERDDAERRREAETVAREQERLAEITAGQVRTARIQRRARWTLAAMIALVIAGLAFGAWQQTKLFARQRALDQAQLNSIAELVSVERLRGNIDAALRLALHGVGLEARLNHSPRGGSTADAELAATVAQAGWNLLLKGHQDGVTAAAFSPDGSRIVTASDDKTARVWDAKTGQEMLVLHGHTRAVVSAAFGPDGSRIVTTSADGTARIWDGTTGEEIEVLHISQPIFGDSGIKAMLTADGKAIILEEWNAAQVWDVASGRKLKEVVRRDQNGLVDAPVSVSRDGSRLLTARGRILEVDSGQVVATLEGGDQYATFETGNLSPDGSRAVIVDFDNTARVWDVATQKVIAVLRGHEDFVVSATFSPDGSEIVTTSMDNTAWIWNAAKGGVIAILRGHAGSVRSAAFSPDQLRVVTASWDRTARVWNLDAGKPIAVLKPQATYPATDAAFSPDGKRVVTAAIDHTRIWNAIAAKELLVLPSADSAVFSPDGRRLLATVSGRRTNDEAAQILDADTGQSIAVLHLRPPPGSWIPPVPAPLVAPSSNLPPPPESAYPQVVGSSPPPDDVLSLDFRANEPRVVASSWDGTVRVWDAVTGQELTILRTGAVVRVAAVSPDGSRIVTDSGDATAQIWDAMTGARLSVLRGHEAVPEFFAFSAEGARVVSASSDKTARVWDVATGQEILVLRGHAGTVNFAAFSLGGSRIVTASDDRTARIWDAATGREILVLQGYADRMNSAAFSPDGTRVVAASDDGSALIWDVHWATMATSGLISEACKRLGPLTRLTRDEMRLAGYPDDVSAIDVCAENLQAQRP